MQFGIHVFSTISQLTFICLALLDDLLFQAIEQLGFENDPQFKVARLFSRILYEKGEKEDGRKLWKKVLYKPPNRCNVFFFIKK